jgi:lantibiotic modifying enzyme
VGWGSVIYLNALLWKHTKEEKYKANTRRIFEEVDFQNLIQVDTNFSLIKGSAGFIVACLTYHSLTSDSQSLFLAEAAAQHLINCQVKMDKGIGWRIASKVPLSGLAHGASGFIVAFALLYNTTQKEQYKEIVYQCLAYENSLFSPKDNNWIDKRDFITKEFPNQDYCSTAWSHGAGGIGLTRLKLIKLGFDDAFIKKDLEIAVQTVLNYNFGMGHTLTYGDFGNLELLYQYATTFNDDAVYQQWNKITNALLHDINQNGWQLGLKTVNSLGLMSGVTGIGYQCLRFLYPDQVPSLLMPE